MEDRNLEIDETNRIAQHEAVKGEVRGEVQSEIARQANHFDQQEVEQTAEVGNRFKQKAIREVEETETELERSKVLARVSQIIDYIFYIIYGLIGLRILLDLLGANRGSGFRNFIATLSDPFLAPFHNLFADPSAGRFQFRLSYIFALIAYILLHLAINGFLRMLAHRKTAV
jgi:uncharacterized protein YggT (Ycf19 family)